ncbi:hypothetical protein M231_02545 [Tremella mesenterica]|uniref:Uncharacterized protein n=1 Tax=Tremella mesenterica TaxID=5217 RepID=A0A4Q1BQ88_TREME|nr:hypothetical protein M231_02545 [Tremella mesenterica]
MSDRGYSSSSIAESFSSQPHSWDTQSRTDDPQTVFDTHGFAALIRVDETSDGIFQPTMNYCPCKCYRNALVIRPDDPRTLEEDKTHMFERLEGSYFADEKTQHEWYYTVWDCHEKFYSRLREALRSLSPLLEPSKRSKGINEIFDSVVRDNERLSMVILCDNRASYERFKTDDRFNFETIDYPRVDEATRFEDELDGTISEDPPRGRSQFRSQ